MILEATSITGALEDLFGADCRIESRRNVSGGDINIASLLKLSSGQEIFLKENRASLANMFKAEARGLDALAEVASRVQAPPAPTAMAWGRDGNRSFLLITKISRGQLRDGKEFGRSLSELHRHGRSNSCGFDADNWIGSTPQTNSPTSLWHEFFAERRLLFQWRLARKNGHGDTGTQKTLESLCRRLPELLRDVDEGCSSLLHGDLWGGNWMAGDDGRAWLIDPAVYYGHREADIAMTELFGGFPGGFRQGYQESWPMEPGFENRRDLYNLYHLLNHLNLFGSSYWGGVKRIIQAYS